ncbi:hypothetical protein CDAR_283781 [Caerostris darwini]|uniref:Uncharacterized protein n=1 Tax=Caerostris darwini TaxID=1538125 RepID=A0AAV4WFD0_9ARAC|nr:hypothetical protein CDAR_283781 [Caerostris darwini]
MGSEHLDSFFQWISCMRWSYFPHFSGSSEGIASSGLNTGLRAIAFGSFSSLTVNTFSTSFILLKIWSSHLVCIVSFRNAPCRIARCFIVFQLVESMKNL